MKVYDNCDDWGSNLQSPAPEADALSIGPPDLMASRAKSVIGMRVPRKTTKRGRDTAETRSRHGRDRVYTGSAHGLRKVYTRSTQGLHKVYTRFTQCLHKVYTRSTLGLHYVGLRTLGPHRVYSTAAIRFRGSELGRRGVPDLQHSRRQIPRTKNDKWHAVKSRVPRHPSGPGAQNTAVVRSRGPRRHDTDVIEIYT